MGERKFTLLELHFHNHGDVTVNRGERSSLTDRLRGRTGLGGRFGRSRESETSGGGRGFSIPTPAVVALGAAVLAAAAWLAGRE